MSFSLRTLFAVVLIAAIFTTALIYRTPVFAYAVGLVAVGLLILGTVGSLFGGFSKRFWIPFSVVGWLYLAIAFTPLASTRLILYLPSTRLSYVAWNKESIKPMSPQILGNNLSVQNGELSVDVSIPGLYGLPGKPMVATGHMYLRLFDGFSDLLRIMHLIVAVHMGLLAGVVASFLLRHKSEPRSG